MMKRVSLLLLFVLLAVGAVPAMQKNDCVVIQVSGVLVTNPWEVGDEQRVPAVKVGAEVWSLEFTDAQQKSKTLSLSGKHVLVSGTPKISYSEVAGIQRFIVVKKVKILR